MQRHYNLLGIISLIIILIVVIYSFFKKEKYNPREIEYKTKDDFYNASGYYGPFAPIPPKIYLNIKKIGFNNPYDNNSGYQIDIPDKSSFKTEINVYINYVNTQEVALHQIEKEKEDYKNTYFTKDIKDKNKNK